MENLAFKNTRISKIVFALGLLISVFWLVGQNIPIYKYAIIGAIFEFLWLPMMAALFVIPILSLIYLAKEKFNPKSLFLYAFLICGAVAFYMIVFQRNN